MGCETIDWPAKLVKSLIIAILAAGLSTMSLAIVALEPGCFVAVLRVIHRAAVDPGQARLPIAEVAHVAESFEWQNLELWKLCLFCHANIIQTSLSYRQICMTDLKAPLIARSNEICRT